MISQHMIGEYSLTISSIFYVYWCIPQVVLNFQRKSTEGLSFGLHSLLLTGYCGDLFYGFGLHLPWQYRLTTIVGLISLLIQHCQIAYYGYQKNLKKTHYFLMTIFIATILLFTLFHLYHTHYSPHLYDTIGMLNNLCYTLYMAPQIIKNYQRKATTGLSHVFVFLALFLCSCDLTSAYTLQWPWPNLVGSSMELFGNSLLLLQIFYYRRQKPCMIQKQVA